VSILGCTSAVLLSSVFAERRPGTVLRAMERFDVAVSQLRALPVLPPTFERRRIALPWSRRGFIAGHTSLPEVPHRGAAGRAQHRGVSTGIDSRDFKLEDVIKSVMNQVESTAKASC
jgi:hypothetical protein